MKTSQGGEANRHGSANKRAVAKALVMHGFHACNLLGLKDHKALGALTSQLLPAVFAEGVTLCRSVHGTDFGADFLLHKEGWESPLALFCFHQHSSGSTYMKLEYFYTNARDRLPCPSLFLLEGPEFTPGVRLWAREQINISGGKIRRVFDGVEEFRHRWLMAGAPWIPFEEQLL